MRYLRIILPICLLILLSAASSPKKAKEKPVYVFGLAFSFADSVICYTDLQLLDSVQLEQKAFLPQRSFYSYQLKNYLENEKDLSERTCMIYFSTNKNQLTKEFNKVLNRYRKDKAYVLIDLKEEDFKFAKPQF